MMTRNQVRAIAEATMRILEAHQDSEPALKGLNIRDAKGSFGDTYTMKIEFSEPISEADTASLMDQSDEIIRAGLAKAGTPVVCGRDQRGTIIKARRTKYLVKGIGGKFDGIDFVTNFSGARLDKSAVPV
jgi:hypothetical protein